MSELIDTQIKTQKNKIRIFITWATVAAMLLFSGLVYSLIKLDQQDSEILANQTTITNLSTALKDQTDQFIDCKESTPENPIEGCDTPVAAEPDKIVEDTTKAPVPTIKGEKGDKGDPPTTTDLLRAVNIHCGPLNNCVGKDGQPGLNGVTPNNQLLYGLVQQCFANGDCKAPAGKDGKDGRDGVDGLNGDKGDKGDKGDTGNTGNDGKSVTQAEIDAAVAAYCGQTPSPCTVIVQTPPEEPEGPPVPEETTP